MDECVHVLGTPSVDCCTVLVVLPSLSSATIRRSLRQLCTTVADSMNASELMS